MCARAPNSRPTCAASVATHQALNGAPCAVAIASAGCADRAHRLHRIGVAYNGSDEAVGALEVARALAAERGATLSAFEAISLTPYAYPGVWVPTEERASDWVDDARRRLIDLGGVEANAGFGDVVDELTTYSESVDLLVVGSRGYGPIGRLVHGSTTNRLARTARSPLLIVTRGARALGTAPNVDAALSTALS